MDFLGILKIMREMYYKIKSRKLDGTTKYSGSASDICRSIIRDCWNGHYLMTSTGHFNYFWTRDFGWCTESLINQGFIKEVNETLKFALKVFSDNKEVTNLINPDNETINIPSYSIDSLPWLVHSLRLSKNDSLVSKYGSFIEFEAKKLFSNAINKNTGLVKKGYYSSIKDYAVRNSSTYDNVMIAMLSDDLSSLGLKNPFGGLSIKASIIKYLWTGSHFRNDLDDGSVSSDANIFPFVTGVFDDRAMVSSCINAVISAGLDKPLPIRFSLSELKNPIIHYMLVPNYQGSTVWTHMGPLFIKLVKRVNPFLAKRYKDGYKRLIEKYGNYLEVLNDDLTPFQSNFYMSDEGMLWAVNYLDL